MNKLISQFKTANAGFLLNYFCLIWVILVFTLTFVSPVYAHSDSNPTSTNRIKVHFSPYRLNPATGNWETTATLINRSKQAFYAPIFLEISRIEYENKHDGHKYDEHEEREQDKHGHDEHKHEHVSVTLVNADGNSPKGESWVSVPLADGVLSPHERASTVLVFAITPQQLQKKRHFSDRPHIEFHTFVYAALERRNTPPVANAGADLSVSVGKSVMLDGSNSTDADGDPLKYAWTILSKPNGSQATLSNATLAKPELVIDQAGSYQIQLIVNDGKINSQPDTVLISTLNSVPVADAGVNQSGKVGSVLTLNASGSTDADGDPLNYFWSLIDKPDGSTSNLSDPTKVNPTLLLDKSGSYIAQLIVNDGKADSAPDSVTLSTINSEPIANAGTDLSAKVGDTVTLDGSASSDVDGNVITYHWSVISRPADSTATVSDATAIKPTLKIDKAGSYTLQLIVNDGQTNSLPDTVTVTTENSAPLANAGFDQTGKVGDTLIMDGSKSIDVDGNPLSYQWSLISKPVNSIAELSNPAIVSPTLKLDKAGSYVVQLIVNDGIVNSVADTMTISTINSQPVANAGIDQEVKTNELVTLDGSGSSDADNDILSYRWALIAKPTGSTVTLINPLSQITQFTPDLVGSYVGQLIVNDSLLDSEPDTTVINVTAVPPPQNHAPLIMSVAVTTTTAGQPYNYTVQAIDADNDPLSYTLTVFPNGMTIDATTGVILWTPQLTQVGFHTVNLSVSDGRGGIDTQNFLIAVNVPTNSAIVPNVQGLVRSSAENQIQQAKLQVGSLTFQHSDTVTDGQVMSQTPNASTVVALGTPVNLVVSLGKDNGLPPNPEIVAPNIDPTVATSTYAATQFLYSGANPIQTGVQPNTIEAKRVAVLRGKVLDKQNNPLSGVTITILNHPEFGQTLSRADGMFDLAVNGGGYLTVNYRKDSYINIQRQVNTPWQDYVLIDDAVMIQLDSLVTQIDLSNATTMQVARGNPVTDADGTRQATLLFPTGTQATMTLSDGSTQPLTTLHVRATEFTVGPNGPKMMPAILPPTTGYTYEVEFSVDEAEAAKATHISFNHLLINYTENFLNFPVGMLVPYGEYDRKNGVWIASNNGRVIKILSINQGLATLSIDSSGQAASAAELTALGISQEELQNLAILYSSGQSLWRVPIDHLLAIN